MERFFIAGLVSPVPRAMIFLSLSLAVHYFIVPPGFFASEKNPAGSVPLALSYSSRALSDFYLPTKKPSLDDRGTAAVLSAKSLPTAEAPVSVDDVKKKVFAVADLNRQVDPPVAQLTDEKKTVSTDFPGANATPPRRWLRQVTEPLRLPRQRLEVATEPSVVKTKPQKTEEIKGPGTAVIEPSTKVSDVQPLNREATMPPAGGMVAQGIETLSSAPSGLKAAVLQENRLALMPVESQGAAGAIADRSALPRYDLNPHPDYPRVAKLRGWEGEVRFEVLVLASGRVGQIRLLNSSGYRSLDDSARKAIRRWRFKPALRSGLPIESRVTVPVRFSLHNP